MVQEPGVCMRGPMLKLPLSSRKTTLGVPILKASPMLSQGSSEHLLAGFLCSLLGGRLKLSEPRPIHLQCCSHELAVLCLNYGGIWKSKHEPFFGKSQHQPRQPLSFVARIPVAGKPWLCAVYLGLNVV